jgi:hypothetical protein
MVVIDTCSLISFVRYYLPLDSSKSLYDFLQDKIEQKEIIVIDEVYSECEFFAKGLVVDALPYLKKHKVKTTECIADRKFYHFANNDFVSPVGRRATPEEFEVLQQEFLEGADAKLVLYCLKYKAVNCRVVTEESEGHNDNKAFKKIPSLCNTVEIKSVPLPNFLQELGVEFIFKQ